MMQTMIIINLHLAKQSFVRVRTGQTMHTNCPHIQLPGCGATDVGYTATVFRVTTSLPVENAVRLLVRKVITMFSVTSSEVKYVLALLLRTI
jgi:hypothetical protein